MSKVAEFYDDFTEYQLSHGINPRHRSIQDWLVKAGLLESHKVLEIGCGIGTQTELLLNYLSNEASVLAVDISPKSIEIAKKRLGKFNNVELIAADIVQLPLKDKFDVVLLPDVLEHIPKEQHLKLFEKIAQVLKMDGFVLIHIPEPHYLEWCTIHHKDELQIIDQPIFIDEFVGSINPNNLYIDFLQNYSIWIDNKDYRVIKLKKRVELDKRKYNIIENHPSLLTRLVAKIKRNISKG